MIPAIVAHLQADAALASLLTGGVHDATQVGVISRQTTPGAFDANGELLPCALVQSTRADPVPRFRGLETLGVACYLYQRSGSGVIESARQRIAVLLDRRRIVPTSGHAWEVQRASNALDGRDVGLRATVILSRFTVVRTYA